MFRYILLVVAFLSINHAVSWGADKEPAFTQKEFARLILHEFSWGDGLSKEPVDRDYLLILGGRRTFRYEAENAYNKDTDLVTVRDFSLFGEFTGKGWIFGVSEATESVFTILLPIAGEYDLKAVVKGEGFIWRINNVEYRAGSKSGNFKEIDVGKLKLEAGVVTVKLTIPPEGAIDSFSLSAPDHTPVQPFSGWRFRAGVTAAHLAEIMVALDNAYARLPDVAQEAPPKPLAVFDKLTLPPTAAYTTAPYLGSFAAPRWVRADFRGATLQTRITVSEPGYYTVTLNAMGESISGSVNDVKFNLEGKPYLSKVNIGLYRLESGENTFQVNIPPSGGVDTVEIVRKSTMPNDFLRLSGVPGPAERLIKKEEATLFLRKIKTSLSTRK